MMRYGLAPRCSFGGGRSQPTTNQGWRYDPIGDAWTPMSTIGSPATRTGATVAWSGSEMMVWGGLSGTVLNTGARYDPLNDTWTPMSITSAPEARWRQAGVWADTELIIWGGCTHGQCTRHVATGGRYDPITDTWVPTATTGAASARSSAHAFWTGAEVIIWGGCSGGECQISLSTGARYTPAKDSWIPMANHPDVPIGRLQHTSVWTGTEMIIWGGMALFLEVSGGRYEPSTDTWRPTRFMVETPGARDGHTAVWTGTEMIIWGGRMAGVGETITGGRYDPMTDSWFATSTTGAPRERAFHRAVWTGTEMIIWGGCGFGCGSFLSTGARYDPATNGWYEVSPIDAPSARFLHSMVWTGAEMIVWGGRTSADEFNNGALYEPVTNTWRSMTLTDAPSRRSNHSTNWTGAEMIVWGGANGGRSGGRYDPFFDLWTSTSQKGAPTPRSGHTSVWTDEYMIIWGGRSEGGGLPFPNIGGWYHPVFDFWVETAGIYAPDGRATHTAVWTGFEMIIWGGYARHTRDFKGAGRYCGPSTAP